MSFLQKKFSNKKSIMNLVVLLAAGVPQGLWAEPETQESLELMADSLRYESSGEKVVAEGNVEVRNGDATLTAHSLIGILSQTKEVLPTQHLGGGMNLRKLEAYGNVRYQSPRETARGAEATYDMGRQILVVKGDLAEVTMGEVALKGEIIEYDKGALKLEATQNVSLSKPDQRLKAQRIIAYFKEKGGQNQSRPKVAQNSGKLVLSSAYAMGGVEVETPNYKGSAQSAQIEGDEMTFSGKVRIIQGPNLVSGDCGWYHMKERTGGVRKCGLEKKEGCVGQKRVRALVYTKKMDLNKGRSQG